VLEIARDWPPWSRLLAGRPKVRRWTGPGTPPRSRGHEALDGQGAKGARGFSRQGEAFEVNAGPRDSEPQESSAQLEHQGRRPAQERLGLG